MPKMPVMEAAVKILESEGVDVCFGIPGAAILPLYKALSKSTKIKHLTMRHEEGATHAADGWARATGKVGVAIGTSGPAGTNMVTGLYTCQGDSIPIVCITGQAVKSILHKEPFQGVDIAEIVKPVVKKSYCVLETAQIPQVFREAFRIAREGRPGPVLIDLPLNVQRGEVEYDPDIDAPLEVTESGAGYPEDPTGDGDAPQGRAADPHDGRRCDVGPGRASIRAIGRVSADSGHPDLHGRGRDRLQPSPLRRPGGLPDQHASAATSCSWSRTWSSASGTGSPTGTPAISPSIAASGSLSTSTSSRRQLGKVFPPDLGIVSDAKLAVEALVRVAKEMTPSVPQRLVQEGGGLQAALPPQDGLRPSSHQAQRVFKEINEFFDPDTIFVTAIGLYQIWSGQFQEIQKPETYFCCGQAGPLGWEVPTCLGMKLGKPNAQVVGVVG